MGAHPYWYFVPHEPDLGVALDKLRTREFEAGRYSPVQRRLEFWPESKLHAQCPGKGHATIKAAMRASAEEGTRSILDIERIGDTPVPAYGCATPLAPDDLIRLFETDRPVRAQVEGLVRGETPEQAEFFDEIGRGTARYILVYEAGSPAEVFFVGYSYD